MQMLHYDPPTQHDDGGTEGVCVFENDEAFGRRREEKGKKVNEEETMQQETV